MKRIVLALLGAIALMLGATWIPAAATPPQVDLAIDSTVLNYSVAHGFHSNVGLSIENFGATKATDGVLTLTFGSGLSLGPFGVETQTPEHLACTTASNVVTCPIDHLDTFDGSFMNVDIAAAASLPIGAKPSLKIEIEPTGGAIDTDSSNNVASTSVKIVGLAHLHNSLFIPTSALVVNEPVLGTATVTNEGPDPAVNVSVSVGVLSPQGAVRVAYADGTPIPTKQQFYAQFNLGTIAPGKSVQRSIQITGLVVGAPHVLFLINGGSDVTVDPRQECDSRACLGSASIPLTIVAKASGGTGAGSGTGSGGGNLANTGTPVVPTTLLATALIAIGVLVLRLGRRRTPAVTP